MGRAGSKNNPPFHVLIAAAGTGERAGCGRPKQYMKIGLKTLLRHTIDRFIDMPNLKSLRVVIHPEYLNEYHATVAGLDLAPFILGSEERISSISNALRAINDISDQEIILVHDAARPLVQQADIEQLLTAMQYEKAATLVRPVSDTLRRSEAGNYAGDLVDRDGTWSIQTPQAFQFGVLKQAHFEAGAAQFTDDSALVSALGIPVKLVQGSALNFKITYPDDFMKAERIMAGAYETRSGSGFDVHAFDLGDRDRPLMLCGVRVAHDRGLAGHSDADVGLHAITDALLGAAGMGDIGQHFPPSDPSFKNRDSAFFLEKAQEMLGGKGGIIRNIDITLICEAPKIGPYRLQMQDRIADILKIDVTRVNVKATTTEMLGFTGRGEGIAAQAIVTIGMPVP